MSRSIIFFLVLCLSQTAVAQKSKEPSLGDMMRQMQEMLNQFDQGEGFSFSFPDMSGDSAFLQMFNLDSTMFSMPHMKSMPNEQQEFGMQDFFRMFEGFGALGDQPQLDDGNTRKEEDVLPEEQLRTEEGESTREEAPKPKPAQQKNKSRSTVRI